MLGEEANHCLGERAVPLFANDASLVFFQSSPCLMKLLLQKIKWSTKRLIFLTDQPRRENSLGLWNASNLETVLILQPLGFFLSVDNIDLSWKNRTILAELKAKTFYQHELSLALFQKFYFLTKLDLDTLLNWKNCSIEKAKTFYYFRLALTIVFLTTKLIFCSLTNKPLSSESGFRTPRENFSCHCPFVKMALRNALRYVWGISYCSV